MLAPASVTAPAAERPPDVSLYAKALEKYVQADGKVHYAGLRDDIEDLDRFVGQIARVSPRSHPELFPGPEAGLAYWLNTYNALVLWAFAREYPEKRNRLKGLIGRALFFYRKKFVVGGKKLSLAAIENGIIRKRFREPRIHFALVCASRSCPRLARKPYTAEHLEARLEEETRRFLNEERNVRIDPAARTVTLSKLFDWYAEDFGDSNTKRLAFVARYRPDGEALRKGKWRVRYFDYDWSPNDVQNPPPPGGAYSVSADPDDPSRCGPSAGPEPESRSRTASPEHLRRRPAAR